MRTDLKVALAVAGIAVAASAGAQTIIYERSNPVVISPADEIYQARVVSARAVAGAPQQQCWSEPKQIGPLELPGAIIAGTVDLFAGRKSTTYVEQCRTVASGTAYWDVTYEFRGTAHSIRMSAPPGPTIAVNGYGQPLA